MARPERYLETRAELDTDPLVRGYDSMDDAQATVSMNVVDRPADATPIQQIRQYIMTSKYRENTGSDVTALQIWGRLILAADGTVGEDIFGAAPPQPLSLEHKAACQAFLDATRHMDVETAIDLNIAGVNQLLNDVRDAQVMGNGDKNTIMAFADNQQSRGQELGLGRIRIGDIQNARALSLSP